jgi:hypothetical protein
MARIPREIDLIFPWIYIMILNSNFLKKRFRALEINKLKEMKMVGVLAIEPLKWSRGDNMQNFRALV